MRLPEFSPGENVTSEQLFPYSPVNGGSTWEQIHSKLKLVPLEPHSFVDQHTKNPRSVLLRDFFTSRLSGGGYEQIFTPKTSVLFDVRGAEKTTTCEQIRYYFYTKNRK